MSSREHKAADLIFLPQEKCGLLLIRLLPRTTLHGTAIPLWSHGSFHSSPESCWVTVVSLLTEAHICQS